MDLRRDGWISDAWCSDISLNNEDKVHLQDIQEIDDDGEGEEDARMEPRADEPGDVPPLPQPREVRPSAMRPGEEIVRLHNLTHCPYQSWCEVCVASKGRSDHYHREAPQPMDGDIARIQMDFMFVGAEGTFVDEPRAKATVLMVICKDDGILSATEVRSKTDEYGVEMVIRFLSTYESVEIKTDGEPSIIEVARRVQARRDKTTTLTQTSVGGHQEIGAVERANGTVQAQLRAYFLDVQNRMYTVVFMDVGCGILSGRWCATSPIKERNRLRMREQEVVDTNQRWYHLEKWSWRRLQTLTR